MSDETKRRRIEVSVECDDGKGAIQCEASTSGAAMGTVVRKLASAFSAAFPAARASWDAQRQEEHAALGINHANEYADMVELLTPLRGRDESVLGTLRRVLTEHGPMPGRESEEEPTPIRREPGTGLYAQGAEQAHLVLAERMSIILGKKFGSTSAALMEMVHRVIPAAERVAVLQRLNETGAQVTPIASVPPVSTTIPPSLLDENEKRFRAEVAERLCAIIAPDRKDSVDMAWVEQKVRWLVKFQQDHATPDAVRDAALEEAAKAIMAKQYAAKMTPAAWDEGMVDAAQVVRALKSKPATEKAPGTVDCATWCRCAPDHGGSCSTQHALWCIRRDHEGRCLSKPAPVDLGLSPKDEEEILSSGGGFSHVDGETTQAGSSAFDVMQKIQADGMRHSAEKWGRGEMDGPKPEPTHDFGWALARMREGQKVRREAWVNGSWLKIDGESIVTDHARAVDLHISNMIATDWQVVE